MIALDGACVLAVGVVLTLHPALSGTGAPITRRPVEVSR